MLQNPFRKYIHCNNKHEVIRNYVQIFGKAHFQFEYTNTNNDSKKKYFCTLKKSKWMSLGIFFGLLRFFGSGYFTPHFRNDQTFTYFYFHSHIYFQEGKYAGKKSESEEL